MTDLPRELRPLLGNAFPPNALDAASVDALARLQEVLDREVAPMAAENDARGRYPTAAIAAVKRSGVLRTCVSRSLGGPGLSNRFSLEAQLRIAVADSSVAQVFKVHDEIVREMLVYCPASLRPRLAQIVLEEGAIIGLAVAESGKKADDPWKTVCRRQPDGGYVIDGQKIYTTAAAEADYIAVWAVDPDADGVQANPRLGGRLNLVRRDAPGMRIHRDWDALGQRATDSGTITFTGVRAAPGMLASTPENAPLSYAPLRYQAGFAAVMIGIAVGALQAAIPFVAAKSRPWPSAGVDNAMDDPYVRRLMGELTADLAAAYAITLACGDLLDAADAGRIDRTSLAIPVYAAKAAASRAAMRATSEVYALMGTRSAMRKEGFDRYWRNARTLSLHDPVDWKHAEIGRHLLAGWEPPFGAYQ
ncbi:MAG: acyl-CoA dehydrogenase family protein [Alphaproteobacteria bacterium]